MFIRYFSIPFKRNVGQTFHRDVRGCPSGHPRGLIVPIRFSILFPPQVKFASNEQAKLNVAKAKSALFL